MEINMVDAGLVKGQPVDTTFLYNLIVFECDFQCVIIW